MTKLKFLFTTTFYPPYHIGGDALDVKWLAEDLATRGHEVHVMHSVEAFAPKRCGGQVLEAVQGSGSASSSQVKTGQAAMNQSGKEALKECTEQLAKGDLKPTCGQQRPMATMARRSW
ncbi:MAG: hypothetical protein SVP26_05030 [Chloroflexota bacterium]|nr:hypothetical protein [Chloroflexota bacterium]